jgi:hypothetical protein
MVEFLIKRLETFKEFGLFLKTAMTLPVVAFVFLSATVPEFFLGTLVLAGLILTIVGLIFLLVFLITGDHPFE